MPIVYLVQFRCLTLRISYKYAYNFFYKINTFGKIRKINIICY